MKKKANKDKKKQRATAKQYEEQQIRRLSFKIIKPTDQPTDQQQQKALKQNKTFEQRKRYKT